MIRTLRAYFEALVMTLNSIRSYKLRTLLTMLGITIGIFAITTIFTLVNTLESAVSKNLSELGNTVLFVHNWPWAEDNNDDWFKYIGRPQVNYRDYRALRDNLQNTDAVAYYITSGGNTVKAGKQSVEGVQLQAVTYDFITVQPRDFQEGRYFSQIEIESGRPVCILGWQIANTLFEGKSAIGQSVRVRGKKLTVIGVFEKKGQNPLGDSPDESFIMPYVLGQSMFSTRQRNVDKVIAIRATSYEKLPQVEGEVVGIVRKVRGLKPSQEDNFSINKQEMLVASIGNITKYLRIGGIFISLLSLGVGGIGIANIMFVSVKERTREIGIQKALGAVRGFILAQFLYEAVLLCLVGGAIGVLLTLLVAFLGQLAVSGAGMDIEVTVLMSDVIIGLVVSSSIGLVFGFLPAYFASKLDPVEAMRK